MEAKAALAVHEGLCKAQDTLRKGIAQGRLAIDADEDMPDDLKAARDQLFKNHEGDRS